MKIVGIIPARYKSSRFPGKPLVQLNGIPMVIRVSAIAAKALGKENIYIATEDERIADVANFYGYQCVMTSDNPVTGTDRVWEASTSIEADIYLNIQGDEPTLNYLDIQKIAHEKVRSPQYVINGMHKISSLEDPHSINIPKVIFNEKGIMVYISRKALPGYKAIENEPREYWKQVCIYAFSKSELVRFGQYGRKSILEQHEDIEILRFLELNIPIKMIETSGVSYAVDVPEDVLVVEEFLSKNE